MAWTVDDMPDMSEKNVFITGATSGIGLEAARALAARNCNLVLACRNATKMAGVADELRELGAKHVEELVCNLSDLDSVRECVDSYSRLPVDVLLLNAGMGWHEFTTTPQGYETVFATNHLGHFLLCGLLLPLVRERIVVVSSLSHKDATSISWDVITGESPDSFSSPKMYAQSKLANLLFIEELNRRLVAADSVLVVVGAHPGFTKTEFIDKMEKTEQIQIMRMLMGAIAQPTAHGAWPLLMAVTDTQIDRLCYYAPASSFGEQPFELDNTMQVSDEVKPTYEQFLKHIRSLHETIGKPKRNGGKSASVLDETLAATLWSESEKLVNFEYSY